MPSSYQMVSPSTFSFSLTVPSTSSSWISSSSSQCGTGIPAATCSPALFSSPSGLPLSTSSSIFPASFLQSLSSTNTYTPSPLSSAAQDSLGLLPGSTSATASLISCPTPTFTTCVTPSTLTSVTSLCSDSYGLEGLPHASMFSALGTKMHDAVKSNSIGSSYASLPHFPEVSSSLESVTNCVLPGASSVATSIMPLLPQMKSVTVMEDDSSVRSTINKKKAIESINPVSTDSIVDPSLPAHQPESSSLTHTKSDIPKPTISEKCEATESITGAHGGQELQSSSSSKRDKPTSGIKSNDRQPKSLSKLFSVGHAPNSISQSSLESPVVSLASNSIQEQTSTFIAQVVHEEDIQGKAQGSEEKTPASVLKIVEQHADPVSAMTPSVSLVDERNSQTMMLSLSGESTEQHIHDSKRETTTQTEKPQKYQGASQEKPAGDYSAHTIQQISGINTKENTSNLSLPGMENCPQKGSEQSNPKTRDAELSIHPAKVVSGEHIGRNNPSLDGEQFPSNSEKHQPSLQSHPHMADNLHSRQLPKQQASSSQATDSSSQSSAIISSSASTSSHLALGLQLAATNAQQSTQITNNAVQYPSRKHGQIVTSPRHESDMNLSQQIQLRTHSKPMASHQQLPQQKQQHQQPHQQQQLNHQQQQQQTKDSVQLAQQQRQQNSVVQQQQVGGHSLLSHNSNIVPGISGSVVGEIADVLGDKSTAGQIPGAVMQASQQPGMVSMSYHPPMVTAASYMQPPTYDYNTYCRKMPHSPRSEGRHQCYGYGKQHQYHHGELLPPDPTMMPDPRLPHNPPMPISGPFIEATEDHTPMRPEPSSEHVRYFSVSHLVSHSSEPRKGSVSGQQKESTTSLSDDKSKDSPRSKSGSRKSESKARGTGGTKNSSQTDSHSRRRSPGRGSQQGNSGSVPTAMWVNKSSSAHKQGHNYSTEALLSTQNYGRATHRPPANQNYPIMTPNQMYQTNYTPQQMKNFVPNTSFGYTGHDRSGQTGCNPDYNFQLHTQSSGSLAYGGNMAYMPTSYPYQNLPPSSSSMLSGDIMAPPHPAGPYPRFHEFPADQSNFPPNPTFPLPLDPQDMCSGGGLMGAASGAMAVRPPHADMQLVPSSSVSSSVTYSRSTSNRSSGNIGASTSVGGSISSTTNHGIGSSSGISSKRPRYGDTNMVGGGMGGSTNLLEGGALSHISLHSFTPPCDDPSLVHSNLFPGTSARHQGNFLLGHDNLMPINTAQYPGTSSGTGTGGTSQLGTGVTGPPGTRTGSSVVLPPGAPGHVPFSPLRMMDRQQVNMAPPVAPHLSSSLSNFNLTSIIPEIDGKSGDNSGGMASSSRGVGLGNNEILGATIPSQARLPPMPSSLLPPSEPLKGLPSDTNRLPPAVLNNSMNNIFTHSPHHQAS
ncbi:hypothetical protein Hamer_G017240 [Homarus americanus]|uniref:Uncharacterized protein n=1 Tax=Homarus americanus TaxID=6706 RepID=A0A8J5K019_HOMAM|nr:hypothetical protein Hamer_G017240 [Homarus americanus]